MKPHVCYNAAMTELDMSGAIVGVELTEWVKIENAIIKARDSAKVAFLAANPTKKQAAIVETWEALNALIEESIRP